MAAGETSGARFTIDVNSSDQINQEFLTALLVNINNNHAELSGLVNRIYHATTLKTNDVVASLEELLDQSLMKQGACFEGARKVLLDFFHELGFVYTQQFLMREDLQPLESAAVDELDGLSYLKKVSAVFFTAAAATSAAFAAANANLKRPALAATAAAASVVFGALGRWANSRLKKREGAVKRRKEIIRVMIMGAKIAIKDLSKIYVLARRLQFDIEAMSKLMADGGGADDVSKKMAALEKSFRGLRDQTNGYSISWVKEAVLRKIVSDSSPP